MIEINSKFVKAPAFLLIYFYNEEKEYKIYIMFLYQERASHSAMITNFFNVYKNL